MQRTPTCEHCQRNYELRDFRPVGPRIPLLLPCGHTFCEGCLIKAAKRPEITCFTCEQKFTVDPRGELGVKNFVPNIYLLGLLLYNRRIALESGPDRIPGGPVSTFNGIGNVIRKKKLSHVGFADSHELDQQSQNTKETFSPICDECNTKYATCQCKSCDNCKLCDGCFLLIHKGSKMLNKHVPLPLEYPSEEELSCKIHPSRNLEFYDKVLKDAVCAMCAISDRCKNHEIIPVTEIKEESNEQLEAAVGKAKLTLSWFEHSNKVLVAALPDEVLEANDLFADIHAKFTACHTLLLRRQIELMNEASEKLAANGCINNMLQDITEQIRGLSTTIKDYEMIMKDKHILKLKSDGFLETLNTYTNSPCIIQRVKEENEDFISFAIAESTVTSFETCGLLEQTDSEKFILKKSDEVSEEVKEELKAGSHSTPELAVVKTNEILEEKLDLTVKNMSILTLSSGYNELVYVTNVKDPLDFKVQRCADKDRLQVMMAALNKYCRHSNSPEDLVYKAEEGQLVCAQFLADNNWYRARIINSRSSARPDVVPTWQNGLSVEVLYIDYGNAECLPLNRLRQLKNQFLEIPEMAVPCSLTDIVPPFKEVVWPERSVKAFNSLTGDGTLLMNIKKRVGGKLYVDLRKPDNDEPTLDDDRPVSVRDALVFLEVAVFFSPASHPNAAVHRPAKSYEEHEPLEKNSYIDVTVTHIESPHCLYIQKLDSNILEEQKLLGQLYSGKNKRAWKIDWPYRNLVCAAKFSADTTWYRAVVKNVNMDETVDVEYVDYGNSETVAFHDIKKMPPMHLIMPKQCLKVKFHDVDKLDGEDEWSASAKNTLQEHFLYKPLVAVIKEIDDDIPSIELYDTSTTDDVNMNKFLVKKGVVRSTGPSSDPVEFNDTSSQSSIAEVPTIVEELDVEPIPPTEHIDISDFPQYLPAVWPSEAMFTATGCHVDEKANIHIHVNDDNHYLIEMMQDLNDENQCYGHHPKTTTGLWTGQACIAKFSQDNLWYRVKIVKVLSKRQIKIEFIDFGNSEVISVMELFAEPKYLEIPGQCICANLANVEPITKNGQWSIEAITFLTEKIISESVVVSLQPTTSPSNYVNIYLKDSKDLAVLLTNSGLAKHTIPVTSPTREIANRRTLKPQPEVNDATAQPNQLEINTADSALGLDRRENAKQLAFAPKDTTLCEDLISLEDAQPEYATSNPNLISLEDIHHSEYLWYTEQKLPPTGLRFDVTVTQVHRPDIVYIQRLPPSEDDPLFTDDSNDDTARNAYAEIRQLEEISEIINMEEYHLNKLLNVIPQVGMACIGQYTEDKLYYRARIENFNKEEGVAEVLYVDYGTSEVVPVQSLKPISPDLINLPMQAIKVCIAGIKPISLDKSKYKKEDFQKDSDWTVNAMKQFFTMVANKRMIAQVLGFTDTMVKIHLYDQCYMEDSETGETVDVLIGKVMAENNIAVFELNEQEMRIAV